MSEDQFPTNQDMPKQDPQPGQNPQPSPFQPMVVFHQAMVVWDLMACK